MEASDILLTIETTHEHEGDYLITISYLEESIKWKLLLPDLIRDRSVSFTGIQLGTYLYNSLTSNNLWLKFLDWISKAEKSDYAPALLINLKAEELYRLPWEEIKQNLDLDPLSRFLIMRYLPEESIINLPLNLPIDVLIGSDFTKETLLKLPTDNSQRYFRSTKTTMINSSRLQNMLDKFEYNIVHIACTGEWLPGGPVLRPGLGTDELQAEEFSLLLKKCKARLLILHCIDWDYQPVLDFAHKTFHNDGPTILTLYEKDKIVEKHKYYGENFTIDDLYLDIVHDHSLDIILSEIPSAYRPVLLLASGGASVLKISPLASGIFLQQKQQLSNAKMVFSLLNEKLSSGNIRPAMEASVIRDVKFLNDFIIHSEAENVTKEQFLDYTRESGAMVPLTQMESFNSVINETIASNEPLIKRVVNCWFSYGDKIMMQDERLEKNATYKYQVQIGIASLKSIIKNAIAFPDDELKPFYSKGEIPLRIELFSNDFKFLSSSSRELKLPAPPNESEAVVFDLTSPAEDKLARMRVGIYFRNNLIQSILVRAKVGNVKNADPGIEGNTAEVDFSLSSSFSNFEDYQKRELNIALNESVNGSHSFYIANEDIKKQFDFEPNFINTAIKKVRNALQDTCSIRKKDKEPVYRFDNNNAGNEKDFVTEIKILAELGYQLYWEIITNQDPAFKTELSKALQKPGTPIQISLTKSARYVFPWALVYDKPLVKGNYNVCPQFLDDLKKMKFEDFLDKQTCINNGCSYHKDTSIVCPSGFWGFKHIIEQPLSVSVDKPGEKKMIEKIIAPKNVSNIMMGVSLKLNRLREHLEEIKQLAASIPVEYKDDKLKIGSTMKQNNSPVLYFYCHGGRNEKDTWLGVGKDDRIIASDLGGWGISWTAEHPFVFINGCDTVGITPDDFINFNKAFAYCEAAGVMGTEIAIPETLARYFAKNFFEKFLTGNKVGEIIRHQRMQMLKNYNLLGLVYTPYCSSELSLTFT